MDDRSPAMPPVIVGLMAVNLGVYTLWHTWGLEHPRFMVDHFVVSVDAVRAGRVWTLLTSELSHIDAMHLLMNLFGLWVFGVPVASRLGTHRTLALAAAGAWVASLGHLLWSLATGNGAGALGVSGALMSFMVLYAFWFPRRILLLFGLVPLPSWFLISALVGLDLAGALGFQADLVLDGRDVRTANAAHLGGALVGAVAGLTSRFRAGRSPSPAG